MTAKLSLALAFLLALLGNAIGSDWPQFLGPTRNGVYTGNDLADSWPVEGPPRVWQKNVGNGFSSPVAANHKLILFHRLEDKEVVDCLEAGTGKPIWHFDYPTAYVDDFGFDPGPRATPSIDGGFVYTYGAEGMLHCLDASTGKKIWSVDARKQFHALKGFFGIGCSPLVTSNAVLLNIGGDAGAGIVAFDKTNGQVLWKASNDRASYSSPAMGNFDGNPCALFLTRNRLTAVEPSQGKILFEYKFGPTESSSVTAATPLVIGDLVFVSGCYGAGAMLLQVKDGKPWEVWSDQDAMLNHYATCVQHGGFLYGIHGRTDPGMEPGPNLRCVELKTGRLRWQEYSVGAATVTLVGDELLILTEKGELIRAAATPVGFQPSTRVQILSVQVRAYPAIADGYFYARSKDRLVCLNLAGK